jgi:hypothetical protein
MSVYTKYIGTSWDAPREQNWDGLESFVVRRAPAGVDYTTESSVRGAGTSVCAPQGRSKVSLMEDPAARQLPPMPEIGKHESYYAKLVHDADREGNTHLHEAAKVGQYVSLALDPSLDWEAKLKYFRHAIKRHCNPPAYPDDTVWMFYQDLANLVRQYCSAEALRLASAEDDLYAARLSMGQDREQLEDEAEEFFQRLMGSGDQCPDWFNESDYAQLKLIRDQWI